MERKYTKYLKGFLGALQADHWTRGCVSINYLATPLVARKSAMIGETLELKKSVTELQKIQL